MLSGVLASIQSECKECWLSGSQIVSVALPILFKPQALNPPTLHRLNLGADSHDDQRGPWPVGSWNVRGSVLGTYKPGASHL